MVFEYGQFDPAVLSGAYCTLFAFSVPLGIFIRCGAWDIGTVSDLQGEVGSLAGK